MAYKISEHSLRSINLFNFFVRSTKLTVYRELINLKIKAQPEWIWNDQPREALS